MSLDLGYAESPGGDLLAGAGLSGAAGGMGVHRG